MRKLRVVLLSILLLAATAGLAGAGTFSIYGWSATNVDTNPATSVFLNTAETGIITDLDLTLVIGEIGELSDSIVITEMEGATAYDAMMSVEGSYTDDLDITLVHDGTSAMVYYGEGDTEEAFIYATFDDEATMYYPTEGSVEGLVMPAPDMLSAFDGAQLAGTWELQIKDHEIPGDGTDLIAWKISGTTAEVPEPATMLLLGIGLAGLAGFSSRRKRAPKS